GGVSQAEPHRDQGNPGKERYLLKGIEARPHQSVEPTRDAKQRAEQQARRCADDKTREFSCQAGAECAPELACRDLVSGCGQDFSRGHEQGRVDEVGTGQRPPQQDGNDWQYQAPPAASVAIVVERNWSGAVGGCCSVAHGASPWVP